MPLLCFFLLTVLASAQTPALAPFPRDSKGRLQAFDCGQPFIHKPHVCDPLSFSKVLVAAKTAAVVVAPSPWGEDLEPSRRRAEGLIRKWNRFQIVADPDSADLVFQMVQFYLAFRRGEDGKPELRPKPLPASEILVWPHGANPDTDDVVWLEYDLGKWENSDTIAGVLELLHKDVEQAQRAIKTR